jgi:hypothetical protein
MKIVCVLFLVCSAAAIAQNGGTIESRFGIGELNTPVTVRQLGMGGVASALASDYDISFSNPAAWTFVNQLRLSAGMQFEHVSMSRSDNAVSTVGIKGFHFIIPLEESFRLRLVAGMQPLSRSEYTASGTQRIEDDRYDIRYQGSGGISKFRTGLAFSPFSGVSLGAVWQYYFGTIEQSWELNFENSSYFPSYQRRASSHNGSGVLFGLHVQGPEGIDIGMTLSPLTTLGVSRNLVFSYSTMDSTVRGASGEQSIPMEYAVGLSWRPNDEFRFGVDYRAQDWSEAIVFDEKQSRLGAAYMIGVGVEWTPVGKDGDTRGINRTAYRLGATILRPYVSLEDDNAQELFITAGAGFPIFAASRADVALSYSWRGAEASILGTQNVLRLAISVSVGESWFIRRRE